MKRKGFLLLTWFLGLFHMAAQETIITGKVIDAVTYEPLADVEISILGSTLTITTGESGEFQIAGEDIPVGNQTFIFNKTRYHVLRMPVNIEKDKMKNLDIIALEIDMFRDQMLLGVVSLGESELNDGEGSVDNVAGLLQASRDVFLNAAAFDFSQTFFRPRGLDSEHGKIFINGVEMNKLFNGRPQWSNWGGLNDVQRNQVFSMGLVPAEVGFGGLAGSTNIVMRASKYQGGGRISYAAANRSYTGRLMATYNSGETPAGWSYSFSMSRRFAQEAYVEGTLYDANAFFFAVEKKIGLRHSLNFTTFYTPNIRGRSSANTQEVIDLRGRRYNSFWGYQNGELRNSRVREIKEPVLMLNHYWQISGKTQLNSNLSFQFGKTGNSRIDFGGTRLVVGPEGQESYIGGGRNPDPAYYQKLPSYFFRNINNPNYEAAYRSRQEFTQNGQLDWESLYTANELFLGSGGNAVYVIAEDRTDDQQFTANTILDHKFNSSWSLSSKLRYTRLFSENYAQLKDLLGGTGYLDIDFFAEGDQTSSLGDRAQSDLDNRNRIARQGDRYKYNFELHAEVFEAYSQVQFKHKQADIYLAAEGTQTRYQRNGLYRAGSYPENSLGRSALQVFNNFGIKFGGNYRITGRHLINFNSGYLTRAPTLRNTFSNSRQNNNVVRDIKSKEILSLDLGYIYRSPQFRSRLTGYFTEFKDATEISFFYADGLSGLGRTSTTAFVQEVLQGIGKRHLGVELGLDYQVTSTIKLKAAVAVGQYTYSNNPRLYLTSDSFAETVDYGESMLRNYRIAGGPQRAAQIGFEYRDPGFWWFGSTVNFFSHAFADIAPLTRTSNFLTDADGLPLLNYDSNTARDLLRQEQFDNYILVNAVGGKSWRVKSSYIGFFISLNNIFDVLYKTGGFEQSRNANYRTLKEDREREQPVFGNKYWYGTGASYYANAYIRF
ncbi:TonB-dependent receptor [Antarcticibacterium flavum]|uniref:TonB-dependent receptor n=1 Tax=Antarcticibacterium flavum TaxID=2058175 RepID=A0A5B7X4S3_9FLAO|nr:MULTISPECIES: carboxypeptidase-like regulatory domain-containing protein [Antarcticibacterium]MCM4160587.1 TonB-dependent receptor [Antarcticibacterium sp. W02-3]QCY69751.1 TonB-dependent receptor [Antarcticibacterium flavum]